MLAILDRSNIGNALIEDLDQDLRMSGHDINVVLLIFFPPFILLELPRTLMLRKLRPSIWLSNLISLSGKALLCAYLSLQIRLRTGIDVY